VTAIPTMYDMMGPTNPPHMALLLLSPKQSTCNNDASKVHEHVGEYHCWA
jgi:hypothetical protein